MVDVVIDKQFPAANLVPKNETGVASFLTKYPEFNGDGVTIAIFDSGVDPRSDGLQTIPNGERKVIERYDCSGSGDVDTTTKVNASIDGLIVGLSGRKLQLTEEMQNDNADNLSYRVGLKSIYELFPNSVADRISADRKLKTWEKPQKDAIAAASRKIEENEAKLEAATDNPSVLDTLNKENLSSTLDALNSLAKKYADLKPLYDCVLYRTADHWVAVIDTTETGNLADALVLREYNKFFDIGSIDDHLSISINVHDAGDVLEIVGMCSGHGTHVASIASGSHTDDALNGVAPAAKIVSLTIGDSRLGSMETGTALVRAMIKIMELCEAGKRVHVINMSYGEHAHFSASGRLGDLMCEVVNKYGVIWVASAGNFGPALCTIGTPPDIVQPVFIGVGAYVSPEMMEAEHVMRHKLPANCYTWTSRDPCIDGGQGVTVCAPGAAIASVPEFTMAKQQLMNGTSMAAPHVAGAAALLISGLLKNGIEYSPFFFKRALWNTATSMQHIDKFAQGNGLLNVEKAFEYLTSFKDDVDTMIRYSVVVGAAAKGIHIRQAIPVPKEFVVSVEPSFMNDKNISPKKKIAFNVRCTLLPSEPWVKVATFLDLSYGNRSFSVSVDPSGLSVGVHTARIRAYDSKAIPKGSIFEVPITVVIPNNIDIETSTIFTCPLQSFKHNTVARNFIVVPNKATWAVLRLRAKTSSVNIPEKFMIHTMQIFPHRYCKELETQKMMSVHTDTVATHAFKCVGNNVLEVCIAKYWCCAGDTLLEATVEFRGVVASETDFRVADGIQRFNVSTLSNEDVSPSIQLKTAVLALRPTEAKIKSLSSRDVVPDGRQIYQNVLLYSLQVNKLLEVSLHAPMLSDVLYESEYESQLWVLFDNKKMFIASGDAYSGSKFLKLEKGEYTIRLQVRHEKRELLEKVNEVVMLASFKLTTPIALDTFASHKNAIHGSKKLSYFVLNRNDSQTIFMAPLANDKLTKALVPPQCSMLVGSMSLAKDEFGRKVENIPFKYILINDGPAVAKKANGTNVKDTKSKLEELTDCLRDLKTAAVSKLDLEKAEEVYAEIVRDHPAFMQVHMAMVAKLEATSENKSQFPFTYRAGLDAQSDHTKAIEKLERIVKLCNIVIKSNEGNGLLEFYGMKTDNRPNAANIKTTNDKERNCLIDAFGNKVLALVKLHLIESKDASSSDATKTDLLKDILEIYTEAAKYIELTDAKANSLVLWHSYANQHYGRMLKLLHKMYEDKPQKTVLDELRYVADAVEWKHIVKQLERYGVAAHPANYTIF